MTAKRFTHKINQLGMQFICYDDKAELLGTFADADGVTHIVKLLNELHEENTMLKLQVETKLFSRRELEKENEQLKKELDYIQNSITEHIKHQKTELGQKALKEIIADYNEWMLGHKELEE